MHADATAPPRSPPLWTWHAAEPPRLRPGALSAASLSCHPGRCPVRLLSTGCHCPAVRPLSACHSLCATLRSCDGSPGLRSPNYDPATMALLRPMHRLPGLCDGHRDRPAPSAKPSHLSVARSSGWPCVARRLPALLARQPTLAGALPAGCPAASAVAASDTAPPASVCCPRDPMRHVCPVLLSRPAASAARRLPRCCPRTAAPATSCR